MQKTSSLNGVLDQCIENVFLGIGRCIGRYPWHVVVISLLVTALMSLGALRFDEINDVRTEYSPRNSPSRKEYEVAKKFLKQNGTMDPVYIMVQAADGGSLMRPEYRLLIYNLTKTLQTQVRVEKRGRTYKFMDLCEPYCELNAAFLAFLKLYGTDSLNVATYPTIELFGTQAFIGNNIYSVQLKPGTNELLSFNTTIMPFFLVAAREDADVVLQWQLEAKRRFDLPQFERLKCGMTGDSLVSEEVRRMGYETAPLIIGSIIAMILFVVASSFRSNPQRAKPWETLQGCLIPLLALASSIGLLSALGLRFQSIVVASLFLVLAVGVDDVFIIVRSWDRTDWHASIPDRLALTLADAGPSITISSLTNALSFTIGITSSTPAVQTFSIYSAVAIVICYFYQLILFTAVLALSGRRERAGRQSILCCLKANPQATCETVDFFGQLHTVVVKKWSNTISQWPAQTVLLIFMLFYYYIAIVGIRGLTSNISIDRMALPDSYLHTFQHAYETALRSMQPLSVFVMNPGDLRNTTRLNGIKTMVQRFEGATFSYGSQSTFFWLTQYEDFLRFYDGTEQFTYAEIPTFFKSATYFFLSSFVHVNQTACYDNMPECIESFFFMTNYHQVAKYHEMIPAVVDWRRIANEFRDYDVYPYSDNSPFVDQTMSIESSVFGSVLASLLCTAIACVVFIPNAVSIMCAVLSVFSVSVGVFGLLSFWSIELDPLSMAAMIMAIGFSVDYTAHITYHYYKSSAKDSRRKLEAALLIIGWPMMQVGLSTIVALLPLLFKQSYLALVFLKTILVVVCLGMFHGLCVMPAMLTAVDNLRNSRLAWSADSSERSSQTSNEQRNKDSFYKTQVLIRTAKRSSQEVQTLGRQKVHPVQIAIDDCYPSNAKFHHRNSAKSTNSKPVLNRSKSNLT